MRFIHRSLRAFALIVPLVLVTSVANAGGIVPDPVKTGARDQFGGTANADYFAWTQDVAGSNGLDVWVDPPTGPNYKVDGAGIGLSHAVDQTGSLLTWQLIKNNASDVKLYDMATQTDVPLPSGINTSKWEGFSGLFGNTLTFVRGDFLAPKLYLVTDLSTGDKIKFTTLNKNVFLLGPPRLYGNWIVWSSENTNVVDWKVFRYDITNDVITMIPRPPNKYFYAPSVDQAGNVYFLRSGYGCGAQVRLMKWTGTGDPTVVYHFDPGIDVVYTSVFDDGVGDVTVYADFFDCSTGKSDIYSFSNP